MQSLGFFFCFSDHVRYVFQKKMTSMTRRQCKQKVLFDLFHFFNQSQHYNACLFCFLSPQMHNTLLYLSSPIQTEPNNFRKETSVLLKKIKQLWWWDMSFEYEFLCSWVRLCAKIWYQYGTGTNPSQTDKTAAMTNPILDPIHPSQIPVTS